MPPLPESMANFALGPRPRMAPGKSVALLELKLMIAV